MRLQRQRKARGREGEDAPQAKGTKKRQSQGRSPPFRVKGAEVCTSSPLVSQPIQGVGRGGQGYKGVQRRNKGGGKPALKLPASFRLTDSCTFLLAPPRGSSPPQKTAFCSFSPKSSLTHSPLSTASCQWPGQVSRHYHRTGAEGKDSLSVGQRQRQPRAGMKLGEEMESVSP